MTSWSLATNGSNYQFTLSSSFLYTGISSGKSYYPVNTVLTDLSSNSPIVSYQDLISDFKLSLGKGIKAGYSS